MSFYTWCSLRKAMSAQCLIQSVLISDQGCYTPTATDLISVTHYFQNKLWGPCLMLTASAGCLFILPGSIWWAQMAGSPLAASCVSKHDTEKCLDAAQSQRICDEGVSAIQVPCVLGYPCAMSALTMDSTYQVHASAIPFLPKAASENKIWRSVQAEKKLFQGVCHI